MDNGNLIVLKHADNEFEFGDRAIFGRTKIFENYECKEEDIVIELEHRQIIKKHYPFLYFNTFFGIRVVFNTEEELNRFIMEQL